MSKIASKLSWALGTMPEFILGIGEGHMWRASFVRLVGAIVIAWISAQSAALAQGVDGVEEEAVLRQGKAAGEQFGGRGRRGSGVSAAGGF